MATPWETMKQQPNGNPLGKQAKLWTAPPTIKGCCPTRPRVQLLFPEPSIADGFRVCHFTQVAWSQVVLCLDRVLLRDRLPRVIQIYPLRGIDRGRIVIRFRKLKLIWLIVFITWFIEEPRSGLIWITPGVVYGTGGKWIESNGSPEVGWTFPNWATC